MPDIQVVQDSKAETRQSKKPKSPPRTLHGKKRRPEVQQPLRGQRSERRALIMAKARKAAGTAAAMKEAQELARKLLPFDKLQAYAEKNKPSQEWYEEDFNK